MVDARPISRRLLAFVLEELGWLESDGYVRLGVKDLETRFAVDYGGVRGRVNVSVDAARSSLEIWLAPPDPTDPAALVDVLHGGPRVMLEAVLMMYGSPVPAGRWADPEDADRAATAYLRALRQLRRTELAGDWSRFDEAQQVGRAARRDVAEQIRDPRIRAITRGHRRGPALGPDAD